MKVSEKKLYLILIILIIILSFGGLFGSLMEPDSALYASIAKNIVLRNDWVNLYVRGADWLDKPHLVFWLAAASFKIFGISGFAYKLPSFLIGLWGAWYLFKFTKAIFDEKTALISVIILLTALHLIISTYDVRAEVYLSTFTFAAIYHYYKAHYRQLHIIAGSLFAALAIMVKGIFVLIPIFAGFIIYWLFTHKIKELIKPKWWLAILLIFIFIVPELYTLYLQFDLHPEKMVFGQTHVSGLKFFFYDSQFGRFFNNGPIRGRGDITFFLHTTFWAFLPWSVLLYTAVIALVKKKNRKEMPPEMIVIWASAAITFLLFSLSKFQLPHYIIIIFPQLAIITSVYLQRLTDKGIKTFTIIQSVILIVVNLLLIGIALYFDFENKYVVIGILVVMLTFSFVKFSPIKLQTLVGRSVCTSFALMIFLYFFFYPSILQYQAGVHAAIWLKDNYPTVRPKVFLFPDAFSFDFYAHGEVEYYWSRESLMRDKEKKDMVLYVPKSELGWLKENYQIKVLKEFKDFHITKLKPKFLNSATRSTTLSSFYLIQFN
ncbi:glycosyltransferase family 39 protein [Pedobacter sp. Hv1]|uniref:ArnT family glycosyltransferase n=1 Tax=Pedobacter sp. Hv1 TaxID=1740090 RepID=UPI0006D8B620|nr:glycosyltransferase family 39 protein [Pedobacter sp. Hv1]KQC00975.1 glycosyl transferase [Pedobacter sp. Hv1]